MRKSNHFKGLVIATALLFAGFGVRAQQLETSVFLMAPARARCSNASTASCPLPNSTMK